MLSILLSSCDLFEYKSGEDSEEENPIIASVGNQSLKRSEVTFLVTEKSTEEDSINITNRYVQSWIRKQLMIKEAGSTITFDETELNRKLLDYRYALMIYEFEKAYINDHIDSIISENEIKSYYNENKSNFSLKEIIVRTNFYKLEKNNQQNKTLEKLLSSDKQENKANLKQIALNHASNYYIEDSTWVRFEDIIVNTPLAENNNKVELLRNNRTLKVDDEIYTYYFKILEYKLQDQIPPLDFVREEIAKILMNKKKVALVEQLQKDIYKRAQENNEFQIYD
ncbi:peptidylprolyl isomerase [Belliella sp. R4-6]|uniref:Peptidylprolyl isomerase n=1 Tax=Belliella alkalica TaxID=1730871 RepID=A0ABS9VCQ5_9BACT|nr:peptidylprolyl isomerase [Belliella alkalica]MCH7414009.1 peptidylprolyl isomerase [Belliella alkalica]